MTRLDSTTREALPNRAFAYIDARGRRRLPIHDPAHVRNALARFGQVSFEDERAREQARKRLLTAAKRFGIVPVGFIATQLQAEREIGARSGMAPVDLPSGFVTLLMTDIEGSTAMLHRLGDGYRELIDDVRDLLVESAVRRAGCIVETRADELFAAFECPVSALEAALSMQHGLRARSWPGALEVRVRIGIHSGYPTRVEANYIGMAVHTAARICSAAHGGQIIVSGNLRLAAKELKPEGLWFKSLGVHGLRGLPEPVPLFQIMAPGLTSRFPPPRTAGVA